MLYVLISMTGGMAAGFFLRRRQGLSRFLDPATGWIIRLMLFLLGYGIGGDGEVISRIPVLGLQGMVLASSGIAGSILMARLFLGRIDPERSFATADNGGLWKAVRGSLAAAVAFALGLPAGILLPAFPDLPVDPATAVLHVLMFLVGVGAGADSTAAGMLKRHGFRLALLPAAVVIGTLGAVALTALLWPGLPMRESLAVGAGFGYYSLSSLIIREFSGNDWAAVALLSNISREILTLLLAPLLARIAGPAGPAAAGGATSMDTTLAATVQSSGSAWAVPALFSGVVLTILTPFAVTLILII
jgi:uncharacterized membrane protein YbjE (DUF340 family)